MNGSINGSRDVSSVRVKEVVPSVNVRLIDLFEVKRYVCQLVFKIFKFKFVFVGVRLQRFRNQCIKV